jgi:hypothetical protein
MFEQNDLAPTGAHRTGAVPGIAFFGLSLISVKHRISHPVMMEQVIKPEAEKQELKPSKSAKKQAEKQERKKRRPGRPNSGTPNSSGAWGIS